ncbi:hypothetical protein N9Z24_03735 [Gammaproteobacteria bacterium]|nr:hypothetical protein [Gammaproteobacteria bacterium]
MACNLTQGFTLDCKDAVGGIKSIHLIDWASTGFTVSGGEVTATTVVSGDVYTYELPKGVGSMTTTTNVSQENGTVFNQSDIVARLRKLSTTKRNELKLLAQNRVFCIVKDNNDNYWLAGNEYGCDITAMTSESGTAMGDVQGYNFTLSAIEAESPYLLQAAVATTLGI